jgi:D-aminopeptidase
MPVIPTQSVKPERVGKAVKTEVERLVDRHDGAPNFETRTPHWYSNTGRVDAEFNCVVPKTERYDTVYAEEE